jgi:repressor LexA
MDAAYDTWAEADEAFEWHATIDIPLLGVVAAGEPYQAFPIDETLSVPTTLWGGKQVFALRVRGNSMIDEGIHNGDYIVVEPRQAADNGQTVVAEIDGAVTVKKYHRETDGSVRLEPANPEMLPLIVRGEHVRIIGIVAGVLRKFGFGETRPAAVAQPCSAPTRPAPATSRTTPRRPVDEASIDLEVNALDAQLVRWNAAIAHAQHDRHQRSHAAEMAELGRDLQALRDWCARTHKPGLRRALIDEANKLMRRMQRFATVKAVRLPDLVLH